MAVRAGQVPRRALDRPRHHSPLALWHLLSLDAPSVAAIWTWFLAASSGIRLPLPSVAAMFLAVWVIYIADRLLDTRDLHENDRHRHNPETYAWEERHFFHAHHRAAFLFTAAAAALALLGLLRFLSPAALQLYALLALLLAVYFLLIHACSAGRRLPKELAVGIFFAAAVFIPAVARRPDLRLHLFLPALLFCALCSINCLRILAWEQPAPAHGRYTSAHAVPSPNPPAPDLHPLTRVALQYVAALQLLLTAAALIAACIQHSPVAAAIALSSGALFAVHCVRRHLSRIHLRAAADLALVAPLAIALLHRFLL